MKGTAATEMLHIFTPAAEAHSRPGATGKPIPGYSACVMDDDGQPLPPNRVGKLAVKGPTGRRYLAAPRQKDYVTDGWHYPGAPYLGADDGASHCPPRPERWTLAAAPNTAAPRA